MFRPQGFADLFDRDRFAVMKAITAADIRCMFWRITVRSENVVIDGQWSFC
jgi:hypothetical protein